jgi:hypothetical protein
MTPTMTLGPRVRTVWASAATHADVSDEHADVNDDHADVNDDHADVNDDHAGVNVARVS